MAMILSKHETVTFDVAKDFYLRRIKRIVPIYLVVVVLVIALGIYLICPADYGQLIHDTLPAVGFVSNMADILEEADYFDQVCANAFGLKSRRRPQMKTTACSSFRLSIIKVCTELPGNYFGKD